MSSIATTLVRFHQRTFDTLSRFDGLAPLLLRLILAPVMIQAGWNKLISFEQTVAWFGNPDWGLGLPIPGLMAALAVGAELFGGVLLLVGLATRWVAVPLMVTMFVAAVTVHWENGWLALSDASSWLANDRVMEAAARKATAIEILREHGNYAWLSARGPITVLNNGIEFAAMYFAMLLSLFFTGAGRYTSIDHFIAGRLAPRST